MKTIYLRTLGLTIKQKMLCVFLFMPAIIFAQQQSFENSCASDYVMTQSETYYSGSTDINDLNNFPNRTINLRFWELRNDDGTSHHYLDKDDYLSALEKLNYVFSDLNICFNLKGYDTIRNSTYYEASPYALGSLTTYAKSNGYFDENAINVYLYKFTSHNGILGSTSLGVNKIRFIQDNYSGVLAHEIGHFLGLEDTHRLWTADSYERVTRTSSDSHFNAHDAGDYVVDTNAVPDFELEQRTYARRAFKAAGLGDIAIGFMLDKGIEDGLDSTIEFASHFPPEVVPIPTIQEVEQALYDYGFTQDEVNYFRVNKPKSRAYIDDDTCEYIGVERENSPMFKDLGGTLFTITQNDVRNVMSYTNHRLCASHLTIGQGIRMHETIEVAINDPEGHVKLRHKTITNSLTTYDLFIRNSSVDIGIEPDLISEYSIWDSPDIWVRNQNDGKLVQVSQNPIYDGVNPSYVYVRVTNRSCADYEGTDAELKLTLSKVNPIVTPPTIIQNHLDDTGHFRNVIDSLTIPPLSISGRNSTILTFEWYPPKPEVLQQQQQQQQYEPNSYNYTLFARVHSPTDGLFNTNPANFVYNNNNIAALNVKVIDASFSRQSSSSRSSFIAEATKEWSASKNTFLLKAKEVNEPAHYNWYDEKGTLVSTGQEFFIPVNTSKKYKLEVVAKADNYKDYDEIKIKSAYGITSLSPNPAESEVVVTYQLPNNSNNNVYIGITSINGTNTIKHKAKENTTTLDLTAFTTGSYVISLFYEKEIIDSKILIIK